MHILKFYREKSEVQGVSENYYIEVSISQDKLSASVKVKPVSDNEDHELSLSDLLDAVKNAGVVSGIMEDILYKISEKPESDKWVVFARGVAPSHGKDGSVDFHFSTDGTIANLKEDASGRVNIRDMNLIQNVSSHDCLCTLVPPGQGKEGISVKGEKIAAKPGLPARLPSGKGVQESDDGTSLVASIDGMVQWDGEKVNVDPSYVVDKVDASTGNIRFNGSVIVNGEVGDGYEIHAQDDVTIAMSIGKVIIEAGGNVTITGGVLGQSKGEIHARGDVHVKFIQEASVEARGTVEVEDYVLNSRVSSAGPLVVKNSSGWIAGSTVSSETWIYAHTIGIEHAQIDTTLIVGHNPMLLEEGKNLKDTVIERLKGFLKLRSSLLKLRKVRNDYELSQQQEQLYKKILAAIDSIRNELEKTDEKIQKITARIDSAYEGSIYIGGIVNEGTKIIIGHTDKAVTNIMTATHFFVSEGILIDDPFEITDEIKGYLNE
ncbi:MAG: FapA family protein [Thermodesulfobacteriota bacterium]|nr:FapA family protein [Thermodesulfobacteriota bacterium]